MDDGESDWVYFVNQCCTKCKPKWTDAFSDVDELVLWYLAFNGVEVRRCDCGRRNPNMEVLRVKRSRAPLVGGAQLLELGEQIHILEIVNDRQLYTHATKMFDFITGDEHEDRRDAAMMAFDIAFENCIRTAIGTFNGPVNIEALLMYMTNRIQHLGAFLHQHGDVLEESGTPRDERDVLDGSRWVDVSTNHHVILEDGNTHLVFDGLRY